MFHAYRFQTDEEARHSGIPGAHGGSLIIVDSDFHPIPTERVYASCDRSLAEARAQELNDADIPDIFADLFDHDTGGES